MKNKKYQFIWREFGISNLVLDLMPYYFKVGGVIIYEKPGAEGYATLQEIQTREKISFELRDLFITFISNKLLYLRTSEHHLNSRYHFT